MSLLETVLAMCGLNYQTSQEVKGVLEWVEQQGGLHTIVSHLQSGCLLYTSPSPRDS